MEVQNMKITLHAGRKGEWVVDANILRTRGIVLIFPDGSSGLSIPMTGRSATFDPQYRELNIIDNLS